ncbi:hypothetical protein A3D77_04410 [Candidatus Gottesmanbacteria bacterium RIFCSPHIGHO2_02_FULL_39_11]|uniref:Aminotransferase DegT n=1 Tax=Candidatus Gottesmanbacteria bacterium RIFCSPHIGHO2_02_FULL_39_11 TaxID=1798382 RepID=A0A1F5ZJ90_9BACT|nr:MAG: hypothetical protein A3D77_04410 [Candidatus Gottesmanbacteria bacterium RIFCSPHIGHO2_02_FULL_39_11]
MINVTKTDLPSLSIYNKYLKKIWLSGWVTNNGEHVQLLTSQLSKYLGVKNISLVANGTLALQLSIKALDLHGEIITTPFTFAATTNAILWGGAVPVFADINPHTFNLSPEDAEKKITKKTSAILAVHVYGNPCDVVRLETIGRKYKIRIIYDAAHAFGVHYNGKPILRYGDISTLSFHATKIFHTIEGGAVIARDQKISEKLELLKDFGILSEERITLPGINAKMNEFQAVMGLCNLKAVDKNISLREKIYNRYVKELGDIPSLKFQKLTASLYNYSYMPVCFSSKKTRDRVFKYLLNHHIKARKYFYPLTSDFDFIYKNSVAKKAAGDLRVAKDIANSILCLPIYSTLSLSIVDKIITLIKKAVTK